MTIFDIHVERRIACEDETVGKKWAYPQCEARYDSLEDYQTGEEDAKAHSDVEGRTAQRVLYRRLSSSGYRKLLSELLREKYNPLKTEQQESLA